MKSSVHEHFNTLKYTHRLSGFLKKKKKKKAGEGTTMRRLIELIGSCIHFLREINRVHQSGENTYRRKKQGVSEAETKQAFGGGGSYVLTSLWLRAQYPLSRPRPLWEELYWM